MVYLCPYNTDIYYNNIENIPYHFIAMKWFRSAECANKSFSPGFDSKIDNPCVET